MRNENGAARLISTVAGYVERVGITDVVKGRDRKLQDAAARLLRVQAFTLYDADRMNHAEDVAKSALALAKASQNPAAQALMYITLSQIATYAGTGDRGRYYAEQGLKIPGVNDGYRAELHKRKMRALAILPNQVRATLAAYADIRNLDQRSFDFFDALGPGLSLNVGVALSDLGRHQAAIEAFRESANLFGGSSPHYHAQSLIGEITSLLHARMPEVAADRMLVLAHVLPLISSVRDQKEAGAILDASARWMNVPAVREARDQLREAIRPAR
jgi:tetratricopeptide (TPR) repeat protein